MYIGDINDEIKKKIDEKRLNHTLKHGNRSKVGVLIKMDHPEGSHQLNKLILDKDRYLSRIR